MKPEDERRPRLIARYWPWLLVAGVAALGLYGRIQPGFDFGRKTGESFATFLLEMASVLPAMFVLVGLFEIWVPKALVERHAGKGAGVAAIPWMILLATLQAGPLYAAYPVAVSLWHKGCAPRNVFIYLGAFSALKIPMLTFEVAFLGWRFSLARTLITLPVFIFIGVIMERLLPSGFRLPSPDGSHGGTARQ